MVNDSIDDDKESLLRCWSVWHGRDDKILKNYHGDDITKWLGITVESVGDDQLERVTKIDWSRKGLEGPIPATLGELTELRELNLYDNRLEKEIPTTFNNLNNLTHLNLGGNGALTRGIPEEVMGLRNRIMQSINGRFIIDSLMDYPRKKWLQRSQDKRKLLELWTEMGGEKIDLVNPDGGRQVDEEDHETWGGQQYPSDQKWGSRRIGFCRDESSVDYGRVIYINWSGFTLGNQKNRHDGGIPKLKGNISDKFQHLTSLRYLDLSGNELNGPIPKKLANLRNLQNLYLNDNRLTVDIPVDLAQLDKLQAINLTGNETKGAYFPPNQALIKMKENLGFNFKIDPDIKVEQELENDKAAVRKAWIEMGGSEDNLKNGAGDSINMWFGVVVSGEVGRTRVTSLNWGKKPLLKTRKSASIPSVIGRLTALKVLDLSCNDLSGVVPKEIENMVKLEILKLSENEFVGEIPNLKELKQLKEIALEKNQFAGGIYDIKYVRDQLNDKFTSDYGDFEIHDLIKAGAWVDAKKMLEKDPKQALNDIYEQREEGDTALHAILKVPWQREIGLEELVAKIIEISEPRRDKNPLLAKNNNQGDTPLHIFASHGNSVRTLKLLLSTFNNFGFQTKKQQDLDKAVDDEKCLKQSFLFNVRKKTPLQIVQEMEGTDERPNYKVICAILEAVEDGIDPDSIRIAAIMDERLETFKDILETGGKRNASISISQRGSKFFAQVEHGIAEGLADVKDGFTDIKNKLLNKSEHHEDHPLAQRSSKDANARSVVSYYAQWGSDVEVLRYIINQTSSELDRASVVTVINESDGERHKSQKKIQADLVAKYLHRDPKIASLFSNVIKTCRDGCSPYSLHVLCTMNASHKEIEDFVIDHFDAKELKHKRKLKETLQKAHADLKKLNNDLNSRTSEEISKLKKARSAASDRLKDIDENLKERAWGEGRRLARLKENLFAVDLEKRVDESVAKPAADYALGIWWISALEQKLQEEETRLKKVHEMLTASENLYSVRASKSTRYPFSYYCQFGSDPETIKFLYQQFPKAARVKMNTNIELFDFKVEYRTQPLGQSEDAPSTPKSSKPKSSKPKSSTPKALTPKRNFKSPGMLGNLAFSKSISKSITEDIHEEEVRQEFHKLSPLVYLCENIDETKDDKNRNWDIQMLGAFFGGSLGGTWQDFENMLSAFESGNSALLQALIESFVTYDIDCDKSTFDLFAWQQFLETTGSFKFAPYFCLLLDSTFDVITEMTLRKNETSGAYKRLIEKRIGIFIDENARYRPSLLPQLILHVQPSSELRKIANTSIFKELLKSQLSAGLMALYYFEFAFYFLFLFCFFSISIEYQQAESVGQIFEPGTETFRRTIGTVVLGTIFIIRDLLQLHAAYQLKLHKTWFWDPWNWIDILASTGGGIVVPAYFFSNGPGDSYNLVASVVAVFMWLKVLGFLKSMSQMISTFTLMITYIIADLRSFTMVLVVFFFMFGHIFFILLSSKELSFHDDDAPHPFEDYGEVFWTLYFYGLLGDFDTDAFPDFYSRGFFVVFSFLIIIIFLNVLIAIVSDSYDMVLVNSSEIFWKARLELIAEISMVYRPLRVGFPKFYKRNFHATHSKLQSAMEAHAEGAHLISLWGLDEKRGAIKWWRVLGVPFFILLTVLYAIYSIILYPIQSFLQTMDNIIKLEDGEDRRLDIDFSVDEEGTDWTGKVLDIVKRINGHSSLEISLLKKKLEVQDMHMRKQEKLLLDIARASGVEIDKSTWGGTGTREKGSMQNIVKRIKRIKTSGGFKELVQKEIALDDIANHQQVKQRRRSSASSGLKQSMGRIFPGDSSEGKYAHDQNSDSD